jgi:virulence factor
VVANHGEVEPILCTRDTQVLARLSEKYRIKEYYSAISELLASNPDAIMIHSATSSHFDIAKQSLEAGIAVFVDKPMSYTLAERKVRDTP